MPACNVIYETHTFIATHRYITIGQFSKFGYCSRYNYCFVGSECKKKKWRRRKTKKSIKSTFLNKEEECWRSAEGEFDVEKSSHTLNSQAKVCIEWGNYLCLRIHDHFCTVTVHNDANATHLCEESWKVSASVCVCMPRAVSSYWDWQWNSQRTDRLCSGQGLTHTHTAIVCRQSIQSVHTGHLSLAVPHHKERVPAMDKHAHTTI